MSGAVAIANIWQQCLRCRRAIEPGNVIGQGAVNVHNGKPVWMHEACATAFRAAAKGRLMRVAEDTWRIAADRQRCHECKAFVDAGQRLWPRWVTTPETSGYWQERVCDRCHGPAR